MTRTYTMKRHSNTLALRSQMVREGKLRPLRETRDWLVDRTGDDLSFAARGAFQCSFLDGREAYSGSTLAGRAREYLGRYRESMRSVLQRLADAGYCVRYATASEVAKIGFAKHAKVIIVEPEGLRPPRGTRLSGVKLRQQSP